MYCVHCGAENPTDATFCQKCGKRLPTTDQDELTVPSIHSALSTPKDNTPYSNTPSTSSDTVFAPPPPLSHVPTTDEKASPSGLPSAQKPKRRRGFILSLIILVLLKGNITEPAFARFWQIRGGVKAWSLISTQEQGSTANSKVTLTLGNGQTRPASISLILYKLLDTFYIRL